MSDTSVTLPPPESTKLPQDKVPMREKLTYALGGGAEIATSHVIGMMVYQVFSFNLMMTAAVIGTVLMIFRMWDAVTDPLMGWISDNFKSRWGRRRPFILLGACLGCFTFPLFWWAPIGFTETQLAIWMVCTGILFYTSYTIWSVPYQSMLLEMTPDYNERTRVAQWRAIVSNFMGGIVGWFWMLALLWKNPETGEGDTVLGMRYLSIGCGIVFLILGSLPAFFNRERYYELAKDKKVFLIRGLWETLRNKPFQILVLISILFIMGTQVVEQLMRFLGLFYVYQGNESGSALLAGLGATIWIVTSVTCVPIYTWLSSRIGKRHTFMISVGMLGVASLSTLVLYNPNYPWLMLLQGFLYGPAYSGIWLMIPTMCADILDEDELLTGERREGSYASVLSNLIKLAFALGAFSAGLIVTVSGFSERLGADQPDHIFTRMLLLAAIIPALACAAAIYAIHRFPITPETAAVTRAKLEARRGVV
jgi:GPH family glycoside/pentoside/hexuronide:cation symporter